MYFSDKVLYNRKKDRTTVELLGGGFWEDLQRWRIGNDNDMI